METALHKPEFGSAFGVMNHQLKPLQKKHLDDIQHDMKPFQNNA
jgi:hypothetical protein